MFSGKQIWVTQITETATSDKEGVGNVRWVRDSNGRTKGYRWVYNNTGVATVVGSTYFHGTLLPGLTGDTFDQEIVTLGQSGKGSAIQFMAGVAVSVIPIANYGWIQIWGENTTVIDEGTVAVVVGDTLKGVSGQVYVVHDSAAAAAAISRRHILALTADAGGAGQHVITGFIQCI